MEPTVSIVISFAFFLVLFLGIGAYAAAKTQNQESDYLLGGRSFGKWMVGLSAGATGNTSFILIAAVGLGYTQGFGAFALLVSFALGEVIFWFFLAHRISAITSLSGAETVPELVTNHLESARKQRVRSLVSALIFVFIGAYLVAQFAGSAKLLNGFFGLSMDTGVIIALLAILAYCTVGGLRASIWTDFAQAIVMVGLTFGVCVHALMAIGGVGELTQGLANIDPVLLSFTADRDMTLFLLSSLGFLAIGMGFGLSQPHVTVRVMAGRNPDEIKKARWIYMVFLYGTWSTMTLFGVCCRLLLPEIADPEQGLPFYANANFSPWLIGVVLAGMFSTIASSADSQILVCSSALARDFSRKMDQTMTARFGVRYQQAATVLTGVIAAGFAIYSSSTVFDLVLFSISVLSASVGAAMLIRVLGRPSSARALIMAMTAGVLIALWWRMQGHHNIISDVVPGMMAALLVHELVIKLSGMPKLSEQESKTGMGK